MSDMTYEFREREMPRPCIVDGDRCTCHFFYVAYWTHGAGLTVGSFPAGQESRSMALVEHADGSMQDVEACKVMFVDVMGCDK